MKKFLMAVGKFFFEHSFSLVDLIVFSTLTTMKLSFWVFALTWVGWMLVSGFMKYIFVDLPAKTEEQEKKLDDLRKDLMP